MKQLSPKARRLFELARGQDEPDELARNRVARALSARLATEVSLTAAGALVAKSAAAGVGTIVVKSTLIVGVTGALVAAGWLTVEHLRPAAPPATSPKPTLVAKPIPAIRVVGEPLPESSQPSAMPPIEVNSEPSKAPVNRKPTRPVVQSESLLPPTAVAPEDGLREETQALRLAQQALRDKMPQQALRLLDEQDLRFREGVLHQERAAARVLALCQAGRVGEAHAQALRFERLWPRSALLGRIRSACWAP
jgi:hypothetical protein